jgi:isopropylmalate/homocitrate/citramalate synthase
MLLEEQVGNGRQLVVSNQSGRANLKKKQVGNGWQLVVSNQSGRANKKKKQVGNGRQLVVSNQSGRANLIVRIGEMGLNLELKDPRLGQVCMLD